MVVQVTAARLWRVAGAGSTLPAQHKRMATGCLLCCPIILCAAMLFCVLVFFDGDIGFQPVFSLCLRGAYKLLNFTGLRSYLTAFLRLQRNLLESQRQRLPTLRSVSVQCEYPQGFAAPSTAKIFGGKPKR